MPLDEEALRVLANGGSIEPEKWRQLVQPLLERLDFNIHNVFPMPKEPPGSRAQLRPPQPMPNPPPESDSNQVSDVPRDSQIGEQKNATGESPLSNDPVSASQPASEPSETVSTLPPPLAQLLGSIRSSIQTFFTEKPPHTVQRLAELILRPAAHYKTLPAYLRAVDRVISVTSGADVFPLRASSTAETQGNGILPVSLDNGGGYSTSDYASALGSDESLGGALLTPIPWLSGTSFAAEDGGMLEDPNTTAPPPQEIEIPEPLAEEGVEIPRRGLASVPTEPSEEVPHARGPSTLGVEDLGLQDGKGIEVELGAQDGQDGAPSSSAMGSSVMEDAPSPTDQDGDISLDDATSQGDTKTEQKTSDVPQSGNEPSQAEESKE
ncbi:hypothetical protein POX_a01366 [Penicillium oxalicum]|uniref:hypothetical protein n=1 Tax=Penicillium oxalicum TaxID=69781 RepID=UPI0020B8A560|nr:hypothetical protein POX_a01366 [Penicillium oxalicum]KAI2794765.1 hypothetical protein POX_a01366 [Penicillium oxalicum]